LRVAATNMVSPRDCDECTNNGMTGRIFDVTANSVLLLDAFGAGVKGCGGE
jgi:hypothetical protein